MDATVQGAAEVLAMLFSEQRTRGSVFMDGSHNPTPSETITAMRFVQDLLLSGWTPPDPIDE